MLTHIIFSGRVQGVGFRYTALQKAMDHGVTGWVKNNDDGTVELEAEGTEEQLFAFIESFRTLSNRFIKIRDMKITYSDVVKGYKKFAVK